MPGRRNDRHGALKVGVIYPGPRREGVASLAVHGLREQVLSRPGTICEVLFYAASEVASKKQAYQRLAGFDLLLVSLSFEQHWAALPALLKALQLPTRHGLRDASHPLVIGGGIACRINPRPGLPFLDVIIPGDSEVVLAGVLDIVATHKGDRNSVFDALNKRVGVLAQPFEKRVRAVFCDQTQPCTQTFLSHDSLFGNMRLIETGRGCPAGCRFCVLSFTRRPAMFFSPEKISQRIERNDLGERIGLVGASLARHPDLVAILRHLSVSGVDVSPASLDPVVLATQSGDELLAALSKAGHRSVTLAPEAGSERMRSVINKPFSDDVFEAAVRKLGESGVVHLKLYLMYGLPTEQSEDRQAIISMVTKVRQWWLSSHRSRGGTGRISVSLNPFVPKPHTPFESEAMLKLPELKRIRLRLAKALAKLGGVDFSGFSPREAVLQCLVDRCDESLADALEACGGLWSGSSSQALREYTKQHASKVFEPWLDEPKPWHIIDVGVDSTFLRKERERAFSGRITAPCSAKRCVSCAGCIPQPT